MSQLDWRYLRVPYKCFSVVRLLLVVCVGIATRACFPSERLDPILVSFLCVWPSLLFSSIFVFLEKGISEIQQFFSRPSLVVSGAASKPAEKCTYQTFIQDWFQILSRMAGRCFESWRCISQRQRGKIADESRFPTSGLYINDSTNGRFHVKGGAWQRVCDLSVCLRPGSCWTSWIQPSAGTFKSPILSRNLPL